MDLKKKIKSLVFQQDQATVNIPPENAVVCDLSGEPAVVKEKESREGPTDPQAEAEILLSINDVYYGENFDACDYELQKLSDDLELSKIKGDLLQLRRQNLVVSKKMSELILQNQASYSEELQRVRDLQANLEYASHICTDGRRQLLKAKTDFTTASLGILASFRTREKLRNLLRSLRMIKTLQETDVRLRELIEEEDYPGAIQLILECQKASGAFRHYSCISELSSKLQDTLEMTEEQLDVALSKVCTRFVVLLYEKLQAAYKLLGKTQTAMDQLLMHFANAINNKAFNIVLGYVELCSGGNNTNFQKLQYPDLCKYIVPESFTPCLTDLCKALWEVIHSYWSILHWHNSRNVPAVNGPIEEEEKFLQEGVCGYVNQKLERGLLRIWQDIQQKVKFYILASDISSFTFDEFIKVLDIVRRLVDIGEEFCGSESEDLQESVRKQTVNYFLNYHRGCLEELRMFLENESWELCPVRANFSILHLQEFAFLRQPSRSSPATSPSKDKMESSASLSSKAHLGFLKRHGQQGNPFDIQPDQDESEDVLVVNEMEEPLGKSISDSDSDDTDIPEELKKDFVDEQTGESFPKRYTVTAKQSCVLREKKTLILTNTTLNVLRLFGKYMHMMNVLRPIAFDVLICKSQLFDYYMFAVYLFFAKEVGEAYLSNKLKSSVKKIRHNLILDETVNMDGTIPDKVLPPTLSPLVKNHSIDHLYELAERLAAAESLVFLAEQFEFLRPHLEVIIPASKKLFLQQFLSQTISTAVELRRPIYMAVSARGVDYDQVLALMVKVNWDILEIMSQHSLYVDILLRELQVFSMRVLEISKKTPLPKEASELLWEHCLRLANRTFIEGFSQAKKCTNEGRALMQLDYQQFLSKVERITDIRPIPDRELVEGYIKAFYLLEPALEEWIRSHKEYTPKQFVGLINCMTQINKKGRQRLISLVEEGEKINRL